MPINPPRLDDRGFDDLVAELVARVPAHTPEWAPQVGDPGRTLIDLFAWLGDTILYRANLIPERQRLVFLKLLGMQLRPAVPARGIVALGLNPDDTETVTVVPGATVTGPPDFETHREVTVLPFETRVYAKRRVDALQNERMEDVLRGMMAVYRAVNPDGDADSKPVGYHTTEVFPEGAAAIESFDVVRDTVDNALWIALLAPSPEDVVPVRASLIDGIDGRPFTLNMGVVPEVAPVDRLEDLRERRPRRTVFELLTTETIGGRSVFTVLDTRSDTTRGLRRDGVMELTFSVPSFGVPSNDVASTPWAGMGDLPPRIDVPEDAARVVGWLRFRPTEPLNELAVQWMGGHAVEVEQTRSVINLVVGTSNGAADQVVSLGATSVDPLTFDLQIRDEDGRYVSWRRVDDLLAAGRDDQVFVLDSEAGAVRFGDDVRGKIPPVGARVRVGTMKAGGGKAGNVPANTLRELHGKDPTGANVKSLRVLQPLPARGGVEAETLVQAERRIPATLRHRNRAVTENDYRALAATVPGVKVGRVEILPRFKPHQRRHNVPGVVTVMAIPSVARGDLRAPTPRGDRHFIESVHAWLDERRAVGTELYVINPEYVPIAISVGVELRHGFAVEQTLAAVRLSLRSFFWPLPPRGPGRRGWPLGTTVSAAQAEVAVARTPGVSLIRGLRLFSRDEQWEAVDRGELRLQPWQLPELMHVVAVSSAEAPADPRAIPDAFAGSTTGAGTRPSIFVPLVPEVC
ncbi:MAG: putative baseplate assembly protein [Myxococcota bacterium]